MMKKSCNPFADLATDDRPEVFATAHGARVAPFRFNQAVKTEVLNMHREIRKLLVAALALVPLSALANPETSAPAAVSSTAAQTFRTPDDAGKALLEAVRGDDLNKLVSVFGSQYADLLSSGDEVEDKNNRANFATLAEEKMAAETISEGKAILHVGNSDWPFPIPLVKTANGWVFDAEQGRQEILNRRIGRNELSTLSVMRGYVEAQFDYANADRDEDGVSEYAQKMWSEPGKFDGLYWQSADGQPPSPLGPLVAEARAVGYETKGAAEKPTPYHGYYYRIVTRQGSAAPGGKYDYIINGNMIAGFGLVAFPAEYGDSGVMTFIVNHQGRIYQKDLGPETAKLAVTIKEYNPDSTWTAVDAKE